MIVTEGVRAALRTRAQVSVCMRRMLDEQGFIEVETPMLEASAGGADARPFVTWHNALQRPYVLRIATYATQCHSALPPSPPPSPPLPPPSPPPPPPPPPPAGGEVPCSWSFSNLTFLQVQGNKIVHPHCQSAVDQCSLPPLKLSMMRLSWGLCTLC